MATEQQKLKDEFQALVDLEGSTITVVHYTEVYDISSGTNIMTETSRHDYKAGIEAYDSSVVKGLIQAGDLEVIIIDNPDNPTINKSTDKVISAGQTYSIENISPDIYRDLIIAYTLQVRK